MGGRQAPGQVGSAGWVHKTGLIDTVDHGVHQGGGGEMGEMDLGDGGKVGGMESSVQVRAGKSGARAWTRRESVG